MLSKYKKAAEIHKNVHKYILKHIKPGIKIIHICNLIEDKIREESQKHIYQINDCIAFPTGICINNVAAHFTPSLYDNTTLKEGDVCKIDFGTHFDGHIIDSAFTINLDGKYNTLLEASRDAVDNVIKNIGIDVKFSELSKISEEIVSSYELEVDNKIIPLKVIDNVTGHNILPWKIHGYKKLYGVETYNDTQIVDDGDVLAVEIFVSTGKGTTKLDTNINNYSHYMIKDITYNIPIYKNKRTNDIVKKIKGHFYSLPFCDRYINKIENNDINYIQNLQELFNTNILNSYPPLVEADANAKIAQFEDTIYVNGNSVINLSKLY